MISSLVKIFIGAPKQPNPRPSNKKDKSEPILIGSIRKIPEVQIHPKPENTTSLLESRSDKKLRGRINSPETSMKWPINRPESERLEPFSNTLKMPSCQKEAVMK